MSTAAKVAIEKRTHPERFCQHPRCLWRVLHVRTLDVTPCPKHQRVVARIQDSICIEPKE